MERQERFPLFMERFFFLKKGFYDFGTRSVQFQYGIVQNAFHDFGTRFSPFRLRIIKNRFRCFTKVFLSGNHRKE
jgi:hypothetical protein